MTWRPRVFVSEDGLEVMVNMDPERVYVALRGPGATAWGPPLAETTPAPPVDDEMRPGEPESATIHVLSDICPLCGHRLGWPWGNRPRPCPGCGALITTTVVNS